MHISTIRSLYRLCYGLMLVFAFCAIPWFDPAGQDAEIVCGFPLWVARAIFCSLMVALLNVIAWYLRFRIAGDDDES